MDLSKLTHSGFGASAARKLAAKGAIVAILDRDQEKGEAVVKDLVENYSGELDIENFIFVKVDLADLSSLEKAFDKVVDKYGTLWVLAVDFWKSWEFTRNRLATL